MSKLFSTLALCTLILVCIKSCGASEIAIPCTVNANCTESFQQCVFNGTIGSCEVLPIFSGEFMMLDILGMVLAFVATIIASGGGLGGGGLLVPIFAIIYGSSRTAIPLSKATIFGSAIGSLIVLFRERHPAADRPLIDYFVAAVLEPSTLLGTVAGVLLNRIFPNWLITILLILLMGFASYRTLQKGIATFKKERGNGAAPVASDKTVSHKPSFMPVASDHNDTAPLTARSNASDLEMSDLHADEEDGHQPESAELHKIYEQERRIPWRPVVLLVSVWLAVFVLSLLKGGGHGTESIVGVVCGSVEYWVIIACNAVVVSIALTIMGVFLVRYHKRKERLGFAYLVDDVKWTLKAVIVYPLTCLVAGLAAGLLGIGGGMVKSPVMLEMGVNAQVTAATASFMIIFTSSSTVSQYLILNAIPLDYAGAYAAVSLVGAVIGQFVIGYITKKYKKTAFIIFVVVAVMVVSIILIGYTGIAEMIEYGFTGFSDLCS